MLALALSLGEVCHLHHHKTSETLKSRDSEMGRKHSVHWEGIIICTFNQLNSKTSKLKQNRDLYKAGWLLFQVLTSFYELYA